ncbi:hypothetical protein NEUTE1DRAFT_116765 [Neurospora tetrasperma FGSC 2508]|uniref:Uncharacterized protein n=1 Tax=Neurospora tetrasperma (strain FGSC 2508 / ATCC MYA-4615 / P0657) TaxID=510951 RepID=F8MJX0_NEUT8|nr:uncharacterized protein NEUTE1DRAFT_116765 [Neurospora tetrasperma FGSC 2508]EGO57307.1 hypothetical protein NEUTE1DRAFT_116765 [Neurospora tetrasperma FGSC 2508]EGZ72441.1 hypothetical protein NEUTE2DRAFT_144842 [Neurospora tetrasperma FGSC 2509]
MLARQGVQSQRLSCPRLLMSICLLLLLACLLACTAARTVQQFVGVAGTRISESLLVLVLCPKSCKCPVDSANTTDEEEDKQGPGRHATSTWAWRWGT